MMGNSTTVQICPLHLRSAEAICQQFGVSRRALLDWYRRGAPISYDGRRYDAEYNALQAWRVAQSHQAENPVN